MPADTSFGEKRLLNNSGTNSFFAGCLAGVVGCVVGHPFDTVKLVQQTNKGVGVFQGFRKLISTGGYSALWRGMGPAVAVQVITSGFLFSAQIKISDQVAHSLGQWKWLTEGISSKEYAIESEYKLQQAMSVSSVPCATISGFLTGGILAPIVCPLEGYKCRAQASVRTSFTLQSMTLKSTLFDFNSTSISKLFSGFIPSMLRCSFGNAAFFGIYALAQSANINPALGGALAGAAFWIIGFPFDVLNSKMQTADLINSPLPTLWGTFNSIHRELGLRGFYVGLPVTLIRAVPMNAAVLLTYELYLSYAQ